LNGILLFPVFCLFALVIRGQYGGGQSPSELPAAVKRETRNASAADPAPVQRELPSPSESPASVKQGLRYASVADPAAAGIADHSELKTLEKGGNVSLSRMLGLGIRRIVIDAGHGGSDAGTVGMMGTREKDIALDIARRLKVCLAENGFPLIHMTREDDSALNLQERVISAREANADLFLSIHVNYLPGTRINAVETYYFGPSRDQDMLSLAARENTGSEYGLSDFEKILAKLGQTMKLQESRKLAESIQSNVFLKSRNQNENIRNNGVKRAPFVVLLGLDVPSVIAEVSCLSNAEEERDLNSEIHRANIASYLADGIIDYVKGVAKNDTTR
jgi:N-acetylmuramoyl-L-alanine amidase